MTPREVPADVLLAHGLPVAEGSGSAPLVGEATVADGGVISIVAAYGCSLRGGAGATPTDRYELDRATLEPTKREIGRKAKAYTFDARTGLLELRDVAAAEQDRSALSFGQLRAVGALAGRIAAAIGAPVRVRWTIGADGALRIIAATWL